MTPTPFRLDIAPAAPRHSPRALVFLVATSLFALGSLSVLLDACGTWREARERVERDQALADATQVRRRKELAQQQSPEQAKRQRALDQVQSALRTPWGELLDAMERASSFVRQGVSVLSLVPTPAAEGRHTVTLTAVAANGAVLLEYVRALKSDSHVQSVELMGQQLDERVGPDVQRFRLRLTWSRPAQARGTAAPAEPKMAASSERAIR